MSEPTRSYPVLDTLEHDGRTYRRGNRVGLAAPQATRLAALGVVGGEPAEGPVLFEDVLAQLLRADPDKTGPAWTADGRPQLKALRERGLVLTAAERDAVYAQAHAAG
jgi:hypothetical protein